MTEKLFLQQVKDAAKLFGYEVYHTWMSIRSQPGFPDLVIVGRGQVIFAELKTETGVLTVHQKKWIEILRRNGAKVYVWRPSDLDEIVRILQNQQEVA